MKYIDKERIADTVRDAAVHVLDGGTTWPVERARLFADHIAARASGPLSKLTVILSDEDRDELGAARNFLIRHEGYQSTIDAITRILGE